jgi:hypothetical protein
MAQTRQSHAGDGLREIGSSSLSEACRELFARYPLAVLTSKGNELVSTMLLGVPDSDGAKYIVLSHDRREGKPPYSLRPRRTTETVNIGMDREADVPEPIVNAVTSGVPIPRDGSLFGWGHGDAVAALVPVYRTSTHASPDPFLVVMPRTGISEADWPPFTDARTIGRWFWEYFRAGTLISLDDLIAGTPDTVFWANTKAMLGSDCCTVARDIKSPEGYVLRRGIYRPDRALQAGQPVPPLSELLADTSKADLAPRLWRLVHDDGRSQTDG